MDKLNFEATINAQKGNETWEHFVLKHVAKYWLFHNKNCRLIATEVFMNNSSIKGFPTKQIADAVGLQYKGQKFDGTFKEKLVYVVEAKASKQDYVNGFNVSGHYNFVITPKGLLKEVPKGIGWLEVDLDGLKNGMKVDECIEQKQRVSKRELGYSIHKIERNIGRRATNEALFDSGIFKK